MAGSKTGAAKAMQTQLAKYIQQGMTLSEAKEALRKQRAEIGSKGGSVRNPEKGFGSNKALARKAGKLGGTISRRGPRKKGESWESEKTHSKATKSATSTRMTTASGASSSTSNGDDLDRKTSGFLARFIGRRGSA